MSKVLICGGGISGLAAGIYAQQNGYDTEIFEKHFIAGGECTGWDRQGYHIDNCIQFMAGAAPGSKLHEVWKNVGAIADDTKMIREDYFYGIEHEGQELFLYTDIERTRNEILNAAPEDAKEINLFLDTVKAVFAMNIPADKPMPDMNLFEYMKMGMGMVEVGKAMQVYAKESTEDLAERFHNPAVKKLIKLYYQDFFMASTLIVTYAFMAAGTGMIPEGGSRKMAERMTDRYHSLGGVLHTGKTVEKIRIEAKRAIGLEMADGEFILGDYIICATDSNITFHRLLSEKYMPSKMRQLYNDKDKYRVNSSLQVMFGVQGTDDFCLHSGSFIFPCDCIRVGTASSSYMGVRLYDYDTTLFPSDKRVIQVNYLQSEEDCKYWEKLAADRDTYMLKKKEFAEEVKERVEKQYPLLKDRLLILDTVTPVSYEHYCGAYKGSYMSFNPMNGAKSIYVRNTVKGISNLVLAGQWLSPNGGLPNAVLNGKYAAEKLMKLKS